MKQTPTKAYIALGSNLNDPIQQITTALTHLAAIPKTQLLSHSSLYRTPPLPPVTDQPDVINAVVAVNTFLTAQETLEELQKIEQLHGRVRLRKWGPRTLDLDLLLFGNLILNTPVLTLPHPGIIARNFVLYPLAEIEPDLKIPEGPTIASLLSKFEVPEKIS